MNKITIVSKLMITGIVIFILDIVLNPENICRETSGFNWLFLIAPLLELIILVSMVCFMILKRTKSHKLNNWLKIAIVLVMTYMMSEAGISKFLRYTTTIQSKIN